MLDTGVNTNHMDFEGRAVTDANFVDNENDTDLGGHGMMEPLLFVCRKRILKK